MNKIRQAILVLHEIDREAAKRSGNSPISPVSRLLVSLVYIITVVSFDKYNIAGLSCMFIYIMAMAAAEDISLAKGIKRMRYILVFVAVLGIVNPFFDRKVVLAVGNLQITGGVISMVTLLLKGIFTVLATYILVLTSGIENICRSLRTLHVPQSVVTVLLLTYRYVIVLLKEVERMVNAYLLRAPKQKGINIRAWGSFVGLLLIRSMERAKTVYESMLLRGYNSGQGAGQLKSSYSLILNCFYCAVWLIIFAVFKIIPVFDYVGKIFG